MMWSAQAALPRGGGLNKSVDDRQVERTRQSFIAVWAASSRKRNDSRKLPRLDREVGGLIQLHGVEEAVIAERHVVERRTLD